MNYSSWAPGSPSPPVHKFFLTRLWFLYDPVGFQQSNWVYLSFYQSETVINELSTHLQWDGNLCS